MPTNPPRIKPGTVADFAGSMAEAMENALSQEYAIVKGEAMRAKPDEDRHMLFVAIAQGVVRHLMDNLGAIEISVTTTQDEPLIESEESGVNGISVTQIDGAGNRVKSSGDASVAIQTDGTLYP